MSAYVSCAYECVHKDLGRRLVSDLNNAGVLCFYCGDIPDDRRYGMMKAIARSNEASEVFMPMLCQENEDSRFGLSELAVATSHEKVVIPVLLDPNYAGVTPGGLLTGIKITDISSEEKYEKEFQELLRTIRAIIPSASKATGSAKGDQNGSETPKVD